MKKTEKIKLLKKFESYISIPQTDYPNLRSLKLRPFIKEIEKILLPETQTEKLLPNDQLKSLNSRISKINNKSQSTMESLHCPFSSEASRSPEKSQKIYRIKLAKSLSTKLFKQTIQKNIDEYFSGVSFPKGLYTSNPALDFDFSLSKHRNSVNSIQVLDSTILTAGSDYEIRSWILPKFNEEPYKSPLFPKGCTISHSTLVGKHSHPLTCTAKINPFIVSGSKEGTIKTWLDNNLLHSSRLSPGLSDLLPLFDQKIIAGGSNLQFWDISQNSSFREEIRENSCKILRKIKDFTFLSAGLNGEVRIWDIRTPRYICKFHDHCDEVTGSACLNDFEVLTCGLDKRVFLWDFRKRDVVKMRKTEKELRGLERCGSRVVFGGDVISVWDMHCDRILGAIEERCRWVKVDSGRLFGGGVDGVVNSWNINLKYL